MSEALKAILFLLALSLLIVDRVFGYEYDPPADVPEAEFDRAAEVSAVMRDLLAPAPRRPLYRNAALRYEWAEETVDAADAHEVPEFLVAVQMFEESSFRAGAVASDLPTVGVGQIHAEGVAAKGCDLTTRRGQIDCTARFLRRCYDHCGGRGWKPALRAYGTSGDCDSTVDRVVRSARRRVRLWRRYEAIREAVRTEVISDALFFRGRV